MAAPIYSITTGGAVALSAATAKTILGAKAHANSGLQWLAYDLAFDGVSASAVPVLVELCQCSWATNSPGTNSTSVTPVQIAGRVMTAQFTGGENWTTEPTSLVVFRRYLLTPNGARERIDWPLGNEPDCDVSTGFAIRLTAPATVNVRATMDVSRI